MKKIIGSAIVTLVMLMCFGVISHAAPLPLVPGVTGETTPKTQSEQKTSETTQKKSVEKSTESTTTPTTKESSSPVAGTDSSPVAVLEARALSWFDVSTKDESSVDKIAKAAEANGDYRSKVLGAINAIKSGANTVGEYSVDSFRAAVDAIFGWDFSYSGRRM